MKLNAHDSQIPRKPDDTDAEASSRFPYLMLGDSIKHEANQAIQRLRNAFPSDSSISR